MRVWHSKPKLLLLIDYHKTLYFMPAFLTPWLTQLAENVLTGLYMAIGFFQWDGTVDLKLVHCSIVSNFKCHIAEIC